MSYSLRDAYGEYGAVPPGLFYGLVGYQLSFRMAQEWGGRLFPAWRGALIFTSQMDFDTRLVATAHALLQLLGLLQLPLLWTRAEHTRGDARLRLCSEDLLVHVWTMCGFLTADLVRPSYSQWLTMPLSILIPDGRRPSQMLVVAYRNVLRLSWLRALHRLSGLTVFGIAGIRKYVCSGILQTVCLCFG